MGSRVVRGEARQSSGQECQRDKRSRSELALNLKSTSRGEKTNTKRRQNKKKTNKNSSVKMFQQRQRPHLKIHTYKRP